MGFLINTLCHLLFFQVTLQMYREQTEIADQGYGGNDVTYRRSEAANVVNRNFNFPNIFAEDNDRNSGEIESKHEEKVDTRQNNGNLYEHLRENERRVQRRRANADKKINSRRERIHNRYPNRLHHRNEDVCLGLSETLPGSEQTDHDHDRNAVGYYLTKPSDIANMSAMLGPGPIPIPIDNPVVSEKAAGRPTATGHSSNASLSNLQEPASISFKDDFLASYAEDHKKGHKKKLKIFNNEGEIKEENFLPIKKPKKENRMFHKRYKPYETSQDDLDHSNSGFRHKKRKHKNIHNEGLNTREDVEKYHFNEDSKFTNLSVINKSFQSAASKKFHYVKGGERIMPIDDESELKRDKKHANKDGVIVSDKINDEDAKNLCFINAIRKIKEEQLLRKDNTSTLEKKSDSMNHSNKGKGIKSKIEYGDWLDKITLFPDYYGRNNKTHVKNNTLLYYAPKKDAKYSISTEDETHNINKNPNGVQSIEPSHSLKATSDKNKASVVDSDKIDVVYNDNFPDVLLDNNEEGKYNRNERDTERKLKPKNFKSPRQRSIFSHHASEEDRDSDQVYDTDDHNDDRSYMMETNGEDKNNRDILEKNEEDYEYGSEFADGKMNTDSRFENRTKANTETICVSTTESIKTTKPTTKLNKQKLTSKTTLKTQTTRKINLGIGKANNETIDPYEMFLCGQLADDFVNEVLKKVQRSKKISRELGFSNETEETCDRCIELKAIKIPELSAMKNSMGRCSKSYMRTENCSMCCGVPKPMVRFLNVLVYFEKENEDSFYSKIRDDSSFIFTGDYSEGLSRSEDSLKVHDKFASDRSSFSKDTFDRQHLRDDINEDKNDDKNAGSNSLHKPVFPKGHRNTAGDSIDDRNEKENEDESKRNMKKFGKSKEISNEDVNLPEPDENMREHDIIAGFEARRQAPLGREFAFNKETSDSFGISHAKERRNDLNERQNTLENTLNNRRKPEIKLHKNFDRYYGKSNYDYFKQYSSKNAQKNEVPNNQLHNEEFGLGRSFVRDDRGRIGNVKPKPPTRLPNSVNKQSSLKDNYLAYSLNKYSDKKKITENGNNKPYHSKYDSFTYWDNGEYPLYPNLQDRNSDDDLTQVLGNYRNGEGNNLRMVKRDTDPSYEDELIFFEMPDIEYDLYI